MPHPPVKAKISLAELEEQVKNASVDELNYLIGRYCGPGNMILREKRYSYQACKHLEKMVRSQVMNKSFEDIVLSDT